MSAKHGYKRRGFKSHPALQDLCTVRQVERRRAATPKRKGSIPLLCSNLSVRMPLGFEPRES